MDSAMDMGSHAAAAIRHAARLRDQTRRLALVHCLPCSRKCNPTIYKKNFCILCPNEFGIDLVQ
jgi:hypothetical protein